MNHKDSRELVSHDEMLFTLAVAIGKASRINDAAKAAEAALMLSELVTEEDITRTKAIMKNTMALCGCETCLKVLARIHAIEGETPLDNSRADDSFAV